MSFYFLAAEAERLKMSRESSRSSTLSHGSESYQKREMVDNAIRDIKSAIERSKHTQLKSPREERPSGDDPVWVMRWEHILKISVLWYCDSAVV